ncbi:MAG TPA: hypothetical protein VFC21_05050, partial [Bryobacteraceae bacterium]|nr:hypothetical protein [Bryobacteraceae bacterium]
MNRFLRMFFSDPAENAVAAINRLRDAPEEKTGDLNSTIANTAIVAERTIGLRMFDVQIRGAWAMANGAIAEMQTGEGKTLAAVPAVVW